MKKYLFIAMILGIAVSAFSGGKAEADTGAAESESVITGGWYEIENYWDINEDVRNFISDYDDVNYLNEFRIIHEPKIIATGIERVWTQLIQGRRYVIANNFIIESDNDIYPISYLRLLILHQTPDGVIKIEKDYFHTGLFDLIEFLMTGETQREGEES